eukprot:4734457-Amphidinium_carterae.1
MIKALTLVSSGTGGYCILSIHDSSVPFITYLTYYNMSRNVQSASAHPSLSSLFNFASALIV